MTSLPCYVVAIGVALCQSSVASADTQCGFGVRFTTLDVQPVTIHLREVPIGIVFCVLEKVTGTQFRVPAELDYRVTFDIRHSPPCRTLEIIGSGLGLTYRQEGAAIVVVPPDPAPSPTVPDGVPKQQ